MNGAPVKYRVLINGAEHEVSIKTTKQGVTFEVDGNAFTTEVAEFPGGLSFLRDSEVYDLVFDEEQIHRRGRQFSFHARAIEEQGLTSGITAQQMGKMSLVSPMPGRILKLNASKDSVVEKDQALVVIEAMKMENEVRSPEKGRIVAMGVAEGQSVERGTVLLEIEIET
ncbi:MAG: hypothetical protein IPJ88_18330 [Myxococcales bacterium]|nr:MAG: hypothetical protein IPJ88_18330 [Myxococcales bacterium]